MKYRKGITLNRTDHPELPWLLNVAKSHFGKQIRLRYPTKELGETAILKYENKLREKERVPLDPEIHKVVSNYQHIFGVDEFRQILEAAVSRKKLGDGTVGDFGDRYLAHKEDALELGAVGKKFVDDIRVRLPRAKEYFKDTPAADVTAEQVTKYALWLKKRGLAPTTIKNYVKKELSAIFNYGINCGQLTSNPTKAASIVTVKPEVGILTPPQMQQLLNASDHYMQAWFMFGAYAGLRSSEISLISWEDVDLEEGQVYVPGKKNICAERYVTLTAPLKDYCKKILSGKNPPEGLVMASLANTSIHQRRKKAVKATGIKIPRNALRHSFASHHLVHFGNPKLTAAEMGHSTEQMTFNTYRKAVKKTQALIYWNARIDKPLPQEPTQAQERLAEAA